jgi:hypothetical protein
VERIFVLAGRFQTKTIKIMKRFFIFFSLIFLVFACKDEALAPIFTFEDSIKGAYVRLVELQTNLEIDLANFASSQLVFEVEFVDIEQGNTIEEYDIFVSFEDNTPVNGDFSKSEVTLKSFTSADFTTNARGFQGMELTLTATEVASALGLSQNDLRAKDRFRFTSVIRTSEGRVHNADNSSAAVNGDAFQGFFRFDAAITCPLSDDFFTGPYKMSYVMAPNGPFGQVFGDEAPTVTLETVAGSSTKRRFQISWIPDGAGPFGPNTFEIDFLCDEVQVTDYDTGATCGGGSVTIVQGDVTSFDLSDDSEVTINLIEYDSDGGCGVEPIPFTIKLTKQ